MKFLKRPTRKQLFVPGIAAGCVVAGIVGWLQGSGRISSERTALFERRTQFVGAMEAVRVQREAKPEWATREGAIIARTLGDGVESVDSALRQRLYALGEAAGLDDLTVSTVGNRARGTPARKAFRRSAVEKPLRDAPDFVEVTATLGGDGSIDSVLRLLAMVDTDGWIKRITSVRLDPDKTGDRLHVSLRIVSLFVPGHAPEQPPAPGSFDPSQLELLVAANPFRVPPAPLQPPPPAVTQVPQPVVAVVVPVPVEVFPYDQWILTGVARGPNGPEAWLRNPQTAERLTLQPGGTVGDAVLVKLAGERATFELENASFEVRIGKTIASGRGANL